MPRLSVEQAQAGQILAEDLVDAEGRRVLPKGARLSAAVLSRFARWGVTEVVVEGEEEAPVEADQGTDHRPLLEALAHRFEGFEEDEVMMRIQAVARRHLADLGRRAAGDQA